MEDFVPYKLAVKLEQKGFKQGYNIFGYRPIFSDETTIRFISDIGAYDNEYFGENITAPTISQVLKWLREVKKIFICIDLFESGYCYDIQKNVVINNAEFDFDAVMLMAGHYETYELAALAGIEYVIDNMN